MLPYLSLLNTADERDKFTQLYNEYKLKMFYVANRILNNEYSAEDAVHDAFLRVIKNLHKISDVSCSRTKNYLVIIVRNVALTMLTSNAKQETLTGGDSAWETADKYNLEDECLSKINFEIIVNEIAKLPDMYKDAMYLECVMGMNITEISEMLAITKEAAKKRLQRGRRLLIEKIGEKGVVANVE